MVGVLEKLHAPNPADALPPSRSFSEFSVASDDNEGPMPISWAGSMANLGAGMPAGTAWTTAEATAGDPRPSAGDEAARESSSSGRPVGDDASSGTGRKVVTVSSGQALKYIKVYGQLIRWIKIHLSLIHI